MSKGNTKKAKGVKAAAEDDDWESILAEASAANATATPVPVPVVPEAPEADDEDGSEDEGGADKKVHYCNLFPL